MTVLWISSCFLIVVGALMLAPWALPHKERNRALWWNLAEFGLIQTGFGLAGVVAGVVLTAIQHL